MKLKINKLYRYPHSGSRDDMKFHYFVPIVVRYDEKFNCDYVKVIWTSCDEETNRWGDVLYKNSFVDLCSELIA